jgi:hypothetical protein
MKSLLSSTPVLWFLFLLNLVVAVAAAFGLHGTQQIMTSGGMGVVALGAGAGLVQRRATLAAYPSAPADR